MQVCRLDTACSSSNVKLRPWNWCRVCSDRRLKLWKLKGRRRRFSLILDSACPKCPWSWLYPCRRNMSHLRHHACEFWVRQISRSRWKFWMSLRLIGRYNNVNEKNIKQVSHLPCRSLFYPKDTLTVIPDSRQRLQKCLGGQCWVSLAQRT